MKVTILGAHQGESAESRFTSILINDDLVIDAGGLTSMLSLEAQFKLRHLLITHQHYDHIKDLGSLGFLLMFHGQINVYCTNELKEIVRNTILNHAIWLDFFTWPTQENPTYRHLPIEPLRPVQIDSYTFRAIPSNHVVPTVGYEIKDTDGVTVYYTADNGPGCHHHWLHTSPDLLITEVTYGNSEAELAKLVGHLCPSQLQNELEQFRASHGGLPRVIVLHVNPHHANAVRNELAEVGKALNHPIEIAGHRQVIELSPA